MIASSIKKFDYKLVESMQKTKRVLTVQDHNIQSGLGAAVALFAMENGVLLDSFKSLGVTEYALSGKPAELYRAAGIDAEGIVKELGAMQN